MLEARVDCTVCLDQVEVLIIRRECPLLRFVVDPRPDAFFQLCASAAWLVLALTVETEAA